MANCIIHVDGSSYPDPITKKQNGLGWGIVALHDDQNHEASGAYVAQKHQGMHGTHEDIALLHALQYMRDHGFAPESTSIYCDDDLMGHAPTYLAKENFRGNHAASIERRLTKAAAFIGQQDLVPLIMDELARAVVHKVKGHQGHVYQERVDYLAKWHARKALGDTAEQLPFEAWLKKGLVVYMAPAEPAEPKDVADTSDAPNLADLGLADPEPTPDAREPYKPRVRIQYAAFVRTLLANDSEPQESPYSTPSL